MKIIIIMFAILFFCVVTPSSHATNLYDFTRTKDSLCISRETLERDYTVYRIESGGFSVRAPAAKTSELLIRLYGCDQVKNDADGFVYVLLVNPSQKMLHQGIPDENQSYTIYRKIKLTATLDESLSSDNFKAMIGIYGRGNVFIQEISISDNSATRILDATGKPVWVKVEKKAKEEKRHDAFK